MYSLSWWNKSYVDNYDYVDNQKLDRLLQKQNFFQNLDSLTLLHPLLLQVTSQADPVPAVRQWLGGERLGQWMVGVVRRLCVRSLQPEGAAWGSPQEKDACWGLMKLALSSDENQGEYLGPS